MSRLPPLIFRLWNSNFKIPGNAEHPTFWGIFQNNPIGYGVGGHCELLAFKSTGLHKYFTDFFCRAIVIDSKSKQKYRWSELELSILFKNYCEWHYKSIHIGTYF